MQSDTIILSQKTTQKISLSSSTTTSIHPSTPIHLSTTIHPSNPIHPSILEDLDDSMSLCSSHSSGTERSAGKVKKRVRRLKCPIHGHKDSTKETKDTTNKDTNNTLNTTNTSIPNNPTNNTTNNTTCLCGKRGSRRPEPEGDCKSIMHTSVNLLSPIDVDNIIFNDEPLFSDHEKNDSNYNYNNNINKNNKNENINTNSNNNKKINNNVPYNNNNNKNNNTYRNNKLNNDKNNNNKYGLDDDDDFFDTPSKPAPTTTTTSKYTNYYKPSRFQQQQQHHQQQQKFDSVDDQIRRESDRFHNKILNSSTTNNYNRNNNNTSSNNGNNLETIFNCLHSLNTNSSIKFAILQMELKNIKDRSLKRMDTDTTALIVRFNKMSTLMEESKENIAMTTNQIKMAAKMVDECIRKEREEAESMKLSHDLISYPQYAHKQLFTEEDLDVAESRLSQLEREASKLERSIKNSSQSDPSKYQPQLQKICEEIGRLEVIIMRIHSRIE